MPAEAGRGQQATETGMKRDIGLLGATTLIVGSAIGSGIFLLPSRMANDVGSPALLLAAWVVCGFVSLFGALTFAEMAGMYPRAGGQYVFLREAWGDAVGFLYGWTWFTVISTGIIAAVATAFALFVSVLFPLTAFQVKLVAMATILALTAVNYVGVKYGGAVSNLFTILKVAAILALVVAGFTLAENPSNPFATEGFAPAAGLAGGFGLAMLAAFFAYDGWVQATFVASEVKNPQKTVPRAMLIGTLIVMGVYVAATAVYLYVLPFGHVASTSTLAADVARAVLGENGVRFITIAIIVSTFGTVNAFVLSGPRVTFALARDNLFYKGMGSLSSRFATPDFALLVQAELACLLVLSGTYNQLVNYATFGIWAFYGLAGVGFFVLRRKAAHVHRPYKAWGYPVIPALFVLAAAYIVVNTLLNDTRNALTGVGLIALGVPFYLIARRTRGWRRVGVDGAARTAAVEDPPRES